MNIEEEIFKRKKVDFEKLESYGFKSLQDIYQYEKDFEKNFRAIITVSRDGEVRGEVWDKNFNAPYTGFRVESQVGEFVSKVRRQYKSILEDIARSCCFSVAFRGEQANRIAGKIQKAYGDEPAFLWEKTPDAGVFRNKDNAKWYGLIMSIKWEKLDKEKTGEIEFLNIKLDEEMIQELLLRKGFYPAYHMNKKYWITIVLDETLEDEEILRLVDISYQFTVKKASGKIKK